MTANTLQFIEKNGFKITGSKAYISREQIEFLKKSFIAPTYWSVDSLHDYYEIGLAGNLPLMNDVGLEKLKNGGIGITLKTLGIKFSIPESKVPQSIRFTSGMYYNGGDKKWNLS